MVFLRFLIYYFVGGLKFMLRIINSIVLLSAFVSGVSFAGDVSQPAANAASNSNQNAHTSPATAIANSSSNANAVQSQPQTQAQVKLDEKQIPVSPAEAAPAQKADKAAKTEKTAQLETKTEVVKAAENASANANASATAVATTTTADTTAKADVAKLDNTEATTDLKVVEFVLANQVVSREPKDVVEAFSDANERGFAFARLNSKSTSEITFVWTRDGKEFARITSPVHAAKQWRTFSSVKLRKGEWKVQLLDQNKVVLAEKTFTIQ
jgi:hypothetical protein